MPVWGMEMIFGKKPVCCLDNVVRETNEQSKKTIWMLTQGMGKTGDAKDDANQEKFKLVLKMLSGYLEDVNVKMSGLCSNGHILPQFLMQDATEIVYYSHIVLLTLQDLAKIPKMDNNADRARLLGLVNIQLQESTLPSLPLRDATIVEEGSREGAKIFGKLKENSGIAE